MQKTKTKQTIMKKFLLTASAAFVFFSCQKNDNEEIINPETPQANSEVTARGCASHEVLARQLQEDPGLADRMANIERQTAELIQSGRLVDGKIQIPVVFNVIYNTSSQNISLTQLQSQIDVLNEDFNALNSDFNSPNNPYSSVRANVGISFVLDQVIRKSSSKTSWSTNNDMKKASRGGINPTSPTTKLNIWVVNKMVSQGKTILGYAQFPGGSSSTDGVVLAHNYTGRTGVVSAPFNLGRTATHEVGHWMNLRHIWGDATCGSDQVADTPLHNTANYGVPAVGHTSTCTGTPLEMFMNYMDYTDDRGMYMFSVGQKARMDAVFAVGGARASFR